MEIIPYNSNYTLSYQVFFSPYVFPEKSKIVQYSSTNLMFAKSEQGQQFLFVCKRWRNQVTSGQWGRKGFPEHSFTRPTWQWITMDIHVGLGSNAWVTLGGQKWSRMIKKQHIRTSLHIRRICCILAALGNFMGISENQWWKGFYCGYCTETHSTHTKLLQPQRQVPLVSG